MYWSILSVYVVMRRIRAFLSCKQALFFHIYALIYLFVYS